MFDKMSVSYYFTTCSITLCPELPDLEEPPLLRVLWDGLAKLEEQLRVRGAGRGGAGERPGAPQADVLVHVARDGRRGLRQLAQRLLGGWLWRRVRVHQAVQDAHHLVHRRPVRGLPLGAEERELEHLLHLAKVLAGVSDVSIHGLHDLIARRLR